MGRVNRIVNRLVGLLPKRVQPAAKAIVPSVVGAVYVLADAAAGDGLDVQSLERFGGAVLLSLLVYVFPNLNQKTPQS